jgi:hypothetical protein
MRNLINILLFLLYCSAFKATSQTLNKESLIVNSTITIVDRTGVSNDKSNVIAYGKKAFYNAIESANGAIETVQHWTQSNQKVFILLGTVDNNVIKKLVSDHKELEPNKPEGIFYQWRETTGGLALIIGGTDAKGFMYALTELAQQIEDKGLAALTKINNTVEFPDNKIRGLDKFLNDENDASWFFSEDYWQYYIKQLAENRFNRLTLITGYNDGVNQDFMIPVYPYLVEVPGFETVKLKKQYTKTPQEYLQQLSRIGEISHNYGLEFVFGIWGHGRSDELVIGLPEDDTLFTSYCANGMRELLRKVTEIDGIHLRVNYESGVGGFGNTAEIFWKEIITAIGDIYNERNGNLFLDLRAKGLTVNIREWALETGINVQVTSKYSWEGVGLPYHPTEMRIGELTMLDNIDKRQRYGYADFLYSSRDFDYINRLWGIGTIRMFTWADPDYAKRFSSTASFAGSKGFQVTPPLARKENTWNLFIDDSLNFYQWEDQRYWAWYKLFGRLGYSINTKKEVWERTFKTHYGNTYKPVIEAYGVAGKILPLITSSHLTFHPANYNWAEIESGGALFINHNANPYYIEKKRTYQSTEPGDPGLFYSIENYVKDVLNDSLKPKINPIQLAAQFENFSLKTLEALARVKIDDIPNSYKKEYKTNETDLKITAWLAAYHSFKIKAATNFTFYQKTNEKGYLKSCLDNLEIALNKWEKIMEQIQKTYHKKPLFLHDNGTWEDRQIEIEKDRDSLINIINSIESTKIINHWDEFENTNISITNNFEAVVPKIANFKNTLEVTLKTNTILPKKQTPKVHYRIANMASGKFKDLRMTWDGRNYIAKIPIADLNPEFNLLVYFTSLNENGCVTMHPGLFNEKHLTPYYVVEFKNE